MKHIIIPAQVTREIIKAIDADESTRTDDQSQRYERIGWLHCVLTTLGNKPPMSDFAAALRDAIGEVCDLDWSDSDPDAVEKMQNLQSLWHDAEERGDFN